MDTFTLSNPYLQKVWGRMPGDWFKAFKPIVMLSLIFCFNIFNSVTQAQSSCPYNISLVSKTYNAATNQTTFVWSVVNPNPGNGNGGNGGNGTVQDLSHWGFLISPCPNPANALSEDDIVRGGTGATANPASHSSLSLGLQDDKSQDCTGGADVLKFDAGTSGTAPTYYSLVLSGNWGTGDLNAYYKSGNRTGCGLCTIAGAGVGCRLPCPTITVSITPNLSQFFANRTVGLSATITGGTGPYTYAWSSTTPGVTFNTASSATPVATIPVGTSTFVINVSVNDANGCPGTATITVGQEQICIPLLTPVLATPIAICPGASTGVITVTNPQAGVSYQLLRDGIAVGAPVIYSSGALSFTGLMTGSYAVRASFGTCNPLTSATAIIVAATVPTPTFGAIGTLCPGATATLTATFPAGTTVTGVVWSGTGVSGNIFTAPATAGNYTVNFSATVNGCPVTGSLTITVASVPAPTFNTIGTLCPGATTTLSATFPAGTTVTAVVWSGTGVSGTTFTAPAAGGTYTITYSATVNGCPVTATRTITVASVPAPVFGTIGTLCPGATATLSATFPAGTTVTGVVWSGTGVSGTTFTAPATPGTYTVNYSATVNGCPVTATISIVVVAAPAPTFGAIGTLCPGATATLTATFPAGTTVTNIVWSGTGVTGNIFTAPATAGNYTVNFSATANGCVVTGSLTITVASVPAPTFGAIGTLCPGATATLTATFPAGTTVTGVTWSGTGVSGSTFTAPAVAGTYTVTYTATVNGCPFTTTRTITVANIPTPVFGTIGALCPGATATLTATFPAGTTVTGVVWSGTGVSGNSFTAPATPGTYTINFSATVNGCPFTGSMTITVVAAPASNFTLQVASGSLCPGGGGSVILTLSGSQIGVSYQLVRDGVNVGAPVPGTGASISFGAQTVAGTYSVIATSTGVVGSICVPCPVIIGPITVAPATLPPPSFAAIPVNVCPGATVPLTATFPAGTTVTNVTWSGTGVSGSVFTAPAAGGNYIVTYSATVNGCPFTSTITITVASVPAPTFGAIGTLCPGATATLTATFPAGTTVTGVVWSGTGVSGNIFTAPATAGNYTVNFSATVNGCPVTGSLIITVANVPAPTFGVIGTLCPGATATLTATFPAGTTVTAVVWTGTGVSGTTFTAPATAGTYTITYSALVNGCPVTATRTITVASVPAPTFGAIGTLCPGATATLTATFPAGTTVASIVWTGTGVSGNIFTAPATAGNYTVNFSATVNGCPVTGSLTITVANVPAPTFGVIGTLCPGATATLTATFPAGTTVTGVVWSGTGVSGTTFTAPATGGSYTVNYSATVNGCPVTGSLTIIVANVPAPTFGVIGTLCPGATATLTATFPAGTTVTNVVWSGTGVSGTTFTAPATAGNYTVNFSATVNGCPVTGSLTITVASVPAPTFNTIGTLCPGATATLSATFPAGTTVTAVVWSGTGVSGTTFTAPATAGTYTITYSALVNGCPVTATRTITVASVPAPTFGAIGSLCPGATATLTATFPAGTTVASIVWTGTGVSGNIFTAPEIAGTYTISFSATVNGCPVTGTLSITVVAAPAILNIVGTNFCPGGTGTITVQNIQAGVSYQVRLVGGATVGAAQSGAAGTNLLFTNIPAGTYQVVATNTSTGCITVFGNVTIAQTVVTPCVITGPTSVCMGSTNTYTVQTGPGVTSIQWSLQGGNCIIVGTATTPTVTIKAIGPGTFIIRVTVMYGNCPTTCELTVTSTPLAVSAPDVIVCPNSTITLVGSPTGGVWASTNSQIQAALNNTNSTFNSTGIPAGNYPVTYTVTQANGCTGTALGSITVLSAGVFGGLAGRLSSTNSSIMEVRMDKSTKGVIYQLMRNGSRVGSPVNGTGSAINFGTYDVTGDYSVTASTKDGDCSTTTDGGRIVPTGISPVERVGNVEVSAFPNPFSDQIRFTIESDVTGQGVLEVYTILGAKLRTVYQGHIEAGKKVNVDFAVPGPQRVHMIYKMRVGNTQTTGKLINVK